MNLIKYLSKFKGELPLVVDWPVMRSQAVSLRAESRRSYYLRNKERIADKLYKWRREHSEEAKARDRRNYLRRKNNPAAYARALEYSRQWRIKNRTRKRELDARRDLSYKSDVPKKAWPKALVEALVATRTLKQLLKTVGHNP